MNPKILCILVGIISTPCLSQSLAVTGTVYDFETNTPIESCEVYLSKDSSVATTDQNGNFSLKINLNTENQNLIIESIGYKTDSIRLNQNQNHYRIGLKKETVELEGIVLTGVTRASLIRENPISITLVSARQIQSTAESNIIDILVKNTTGLTAVKTGPNISKPFIRGLGYNRVLTLYDGIRQEGQQYGDEHGLEVDDYNIERAEVIKGPASLLYGSDALAGVISLFPYIPNEKDGKIHGKYVYEFQTNNNLIGNGFRLGYSDQKFVFSIRSAYRMAKNYRNPIDGRVYLTNFKETNFSGLAGIISNRGKTIFNFSVYDNLQGIPDGTRDSLTRKFTKQIHEGDDDDIGSRPIVSRSELNSYQIPDLSQHIQHYRLYLNSYYEIGNGDIDFTIGGQQNIRREFTHPTAPKQAGMYMRLNTLNYGFRYNAPKFSNIETAVGINGMLQSNKNINATDFPIPDYELYDGGVYVYAKWKKSKWSLSGGIRFDLRHIRWNDFYVGINPETGFEQQFSYPASGTNLQFEAYKKSFSGFSGSFGATFRATENISLKTNIGRAYRSPNITEIGSNGLDPGAHIIYLGNRNFEPEFSLQEDLGISLKFKDFSAEADFFNNNIKNYIYMETVSDAEGNPILDSQGNRTQQYQQSTAQLYGSEIRFILHPESYGRLKWNNSISLIYGFNRKSTLKGKGTEGEFLPLIPPMKINSSLSYEFRPGSKRIKSMTPKIEIDHEAKQYRYLGLSGTETFTPSYTLFNLGLSSEIQHNQNNSLLIVLQSNNLFDKAYQSHMNRLKYFEHYSHSPNGHYGIYNMGRNITLKISVSF